MRTALDTNVLLDILTNDSRFSEAAVRNISNAVQSGTAVVSPIVYAELGTAFGPNLDNVDLFLSQLGIRLDPLLSSGTLAIASQAWYAYVHERGQEGQCPHCGKAFQVKCPECERPIPWRQRMLADFLIGAHASVQADALVTRDQRLYSTYFANLRLILPID